MGLNLEDILRKKRQQQDQADRPKVDWFSLKQNGQVRVRFLQELSEDSKNYDSTRGKVLFLAEHVSPHNFRRKAVCTFDSEGQCFACEMNKVETETKNDAGEMVKYPWRQRTNMYTWIATEDGELKVLSRPAPGGFFDQLHEFVEENDSLTDQEFKISKGAQKTDRWNLMPVKTTFELPDLSKMIDLQTVAALNVKYEDQKKFYVPEEKEESTPAITQAKSEQSYDW